VCFSPSSLALAQSYNDLDAPTLTDGHVRACLIEFDSEETLHATLLWLLPSLAFDIRFRDPPRRPDWRSCSDLAIERCFS
jgi:hypothetical protein